MPAHVRNLPRARARGVGVHEGAHAGRRRGEGARGAVVALACAVGPLGCAHKARGVAGDGGARERRAARQDALDAIGRADRAEGPAADDGPWQQAGARSATVCEREGDRAGRAFELLGERSPQGDALTQWMGPLRQCPRHPSILRIAAATVSLQPLAVSTSTEEGSLVVAHAAFYAQREEALAWLETARRETQRRGRLEPPGARYHRARLLLSLGRVDEALAVLDAAQAHGDTSTFRADRLRALALAVRGDVDLAVAVSWRSLSVDLGNERGTSGWIMAFALDRAGESASATELIRKTRGTADADGAALAAVLAALPIDDRLYFAARERGANGDAASALRLWELLLARASLGAGLRTLAERHRREVTPALVTPLGPED